MHHSVDDIRGKYDEMAPSYDRKLAIIERLTGLRHLRQSFLAKARGDVLDTATGTGRNFAFYVVDCTVTGIDLSEAMLKRAKCNAEAIGRTVRLVLGDAEKMEFADASFDTVVSTLAMCSYPHPDLAVREMARVCKPEGRLLFLEHGPSSNPFIHRLQRLMKKRHARRHACHLHRDAKDIIEAAGLTIASYERSFFGILTTIEARKSA